MKQKLNGLEFIKTLISKINFKSIIRSVCLMLCTVGFLYQTSRLLAIYMSGKSIVETRFERLRYSQLPAITICMPFFMDMNKFAYSYLKESPNKQHQEIYHNYKRIMNKWEKRNWTNLDEQDYHYNSVEMNYIYQQKKASFKLREMFAKLAIDELEQFYYLYKEAFNESGHFISVPDPIQVKNFRNTEEVPYVEVMVCTENFST